MRIAMIGTRGVPARYGGFETAIEEVGQRLVARGHDVVVYSRGGDHAKRHLGMERVQLPALKHPVMETLSHTALSVGHLLAHRTDVALVFNAANAPLLPIIRAAGIPVAVHVDGLEWQRAKWGPNGRRYYLANERLSVRLADELISDAVGIQEYYLSRYQAESIFLAYGAPIIEDADESRLGELDLKPRGYHLVVARMEPENHVDIIIKGYQQSNAELPLIVVGSVPYPSAYEQSVAKLAAGDPKIRMLGGIWDQELLNALYAGSATYLHGHSVGGTNPSLLRAMGAGATVVAWDVVFNREVLGDTGRFFGRADDLAPQIEGLEADPSGAIQLGRSARERAAIEYRWDDVALGYETLCEDLLAGRVSRKLRRAIARGADTDVALPVSLDTLTTSAEPDYPAKTTVVVPTYNERDNLPKLVDLLANLQIPGLNVLVVDDNSPDGTGEVADKLALEGPLPLSVLHRTEKDGLGRAYVAGMVQALADGADVVVQMDADLSHPAGVIPVMLQTLQTTDASVVIGSRYVPGGATASDWPWRRRALSRWANVYVNGILRLHIKDATAGFKAWHASALQAIDVGSMQSNGYAFQVEMNHRAVQQGLHIAEVPIRFEERSEGVSKMSLSVQLESALIPWRLRLNLDQ